MNERGNDAGKGKISAIQVEWRDNGRIKRRESKWD